MRRKYKTKKIVSRRRLKKKKSVSRDKVNRSYVLQKTDVESLLNSLLKDFSIIGAKAAASGDYLLSYIHSPEELAFSYPVTSNTLKEFFFLRQEELFEFKQTKNLIKTSNNKDHIGKPIIFFGVRSCDVRAVNFHDRFFGRDPKDSYYSKRRNSTIIISIACNKPANDGCFCNATSGGPFLQEPEAFDIQFIDLGLLFLVECNSSRGQAFVKRHKYFFHKTVETNIQEQADLKDKSIKEFKHNYNLTKVHKRLSKEDLSKLWRELGQRCQNCAGCEFICPTCFCFYTEDLKVDSTEGRKVRLWDSCTFARFSRMAGDNNPHAKRSDRISRRFYCKLSNSHKWFGVSGCVGCGRCSYVCPVNLDMESFIVSLSDSKKKQYKPLLKEL